MNRQDELNRLISQDINIPDELDDIVETQVQKYYHHQKVISYFYKPLLSLVCIVMTMMTIFNLSPSTAYACKDIPILESFVKVFCFDKAVLECIDNDYGLYLHSQSHDITLEYMIADDAQISFYFSGHKKIDPTNMKFINKGQYSSTVVYREDSHFVRIQFHYDDINKIEFDRQLSFESNHTTYTFDIPLEKMKIQPAKVIEINQTISAGNQKITVDQLVIYPTLAKLYVSEEQVNDLKLDEFIIEFMNNDHGYTNNRNGISRMDEENQKVYMIESPYFDNQEFTLHLKQISFIKEYRCQIDVQKKTIENLPQSVSYHDFKIENNQITFTLRAPFVNSTYAIVEDYCEDHQKIRIEDSHMSQYLDKDYFEHFVTIPYHEGKNYELHIDDHIYYDLNKEIKIESSRIR